LKYFKIPITVITKSTYPQIIRVIKRFPRKHNNLEPLNKTNKLMKVGGIFLMTPEFIYIFVSPIGKSLIREEALIKDDLYELAFQLRKISETKIGIQ